MVLILALFTGAANASGQTKKAPPFEPDVGLAGKDVIWVPTPERLVDRMLDLARITSRDYLVDLGSGDGRTVIAAAKRGTRAHGIEYKADMVALSRRRAASERVSDKATFERGDLFETDFSKATVVTMFLLPAINMRLRPKLLEMEPGTRIVSNTFAMEDWIPDASATIPNCTEGCTALLWIVPAKVEGSWRLTQGELKLTQRFQIVTGTSSAFGNTTPITNGKLQGRTIAFTLGATRYTGRVDNTTISGTSTSGRST